MDYSPQTLLAAYNAIAATFGLPLVTSRNAIDDQAALCVDLIAVLEAPGSEACAEWLADAWEFSLAEGMAFHDGYKAAYEELTTAAGLM